VAGDHNSFLLEVFLQAINESELTSGALNKFRLIDGVLYHVLTGFLWLAA
jgi:hypothetical protein